jgi:hypothetical protein
MKQKYRIWKNEKGQNLQIQEYAVLSAESRKQKLPGLQDEDFSLLCEQNYVAEEVRDASAKGRDELIFFLRNQHFYPIGVYMDLIADTVIKMYASDGEQKENLVFDDKVDLLGDSAELGSVQEMDDDKDAELDDDADDLLDDDDDAADYSGSKSGASAQQDDFNEDDDN